MSQPRVQRVSLDRPGLPFAPEVSEALRTLKWEGCIWVVGVDNEFSRLRLDTVRQLALVRARLHALKQAIGSGQRFVWLVTSERDMGLNPDEASAVCDEYFAVNSAFSMGTGETTCTVVIGSARRDVIGFLLSFRSSEAVDVRRVVSHARRVVRAGLPIAAVLVREPGLAVSLGAYRRLFRGAFVGPWLRDAHAERGAAAFAATRALADDRRAVFACEDGFSSQALEPLLNRFEVVADLSWSAVADPDGAPAELNRHGAWLKAGAYYGHAFDPRTPAFAPPPQPVRIVRSPARNGFEATWRAWRGPAEDLAVLLDYFRFESYVQRVSDAATAQRYHEFKIFNRAPGGPTVRATLIEVDASLTNAGCALLVEECVARVRARELEVAEGDAFLAAARGEADARATASVEDALTRQIEAHTYLEQIPDSAPLRADVVEFLWSMAPSLGRTLEIGSGTGRLARELASRAAGYVCVDLDRAKMRSDLPRVSSVVADFNHLPFGPHTFESIIANNVLEHARDPLGALRELRRVLRPSGRLYALIPLDGLNSQFALPAHLWKADMTSIERALNMADLSVAYMDALNLYTLGIAGAFPSCYGRVCRLVATPTPAMLPQMTLSLARASRRVARRLGFHRGA